VTGNRASLFLDPASTVAANDQQLEIPGLVRGRLVKVTKRVAGMAATAALGTSALLGMVAAPAGAAPPPKACWGVVSSQRASTSHDIGEHASAQDEPRLGLGNTARFFGFSGPGELGSFLASVDGDPATHCDQ